MDESDEAGQPPDPRPFASTSLYTPLFDPAFLPAFVKSQRADPELQALIAYIMSDGAVRPANVRLAEQCERDSKRYVLLGELQCLYRVLQPARFVRRRAESQVVSIVVPLSRRLEILYVVHNSQFGGHFGAKRTLARLVGKYYWPTMAREVSEYVRQCPNCQMQKREANKPPRFRSSMEDPSGPFERMSVDTLGPFPPDAKGMTLVLVFVDYFTRWAVCVPVREQSANTVARVLLEQVVYKYGVPRFLLSDRGSNYIGAVLTELRQMIGVHALQSTAFHPQTNGLVERLNHTLVQCLSLICNLKKENWSEYIHAAAFAYNTCAQERVDESPFYLVYGREPVLPLDAALGVTDFRFSSISDYVAVLQERLSFAWSFTRELLSAAREAYLSKNSAPHPRRSFLAGDRVLLLHPLKAKPGQVHSKLLRSFLGPHTVVAPHTPVTTIIEDVHGVQQTVNNSRLKPFYEPLSVSTQRPFNVPTAKQQQPFSGPAAGIPESDGAAAAPSADEASSRARTRAQPGSARATYSGMAPSAAEQRRDERIEQLASQGSYET